MATSDAHAEGGIGLRRGWHRATPRVVLGDLASGMGLRSRPVRSLLRRTATRPPGGMRLRRRLMASNRRVSTRRTNSNLRSGGSRIRRPGSGRYRNLEIPVESVPTTASPGAAE